MGFFYEYFTVTNVSMEFCNAGLKMWLNNAAILELYVELKNCNVNCIIE